MARPASTPRLAKIDCAALADEAHAACAEYLHSLAMRISPSAVLDLRGAELSQVRHAVRALTGYAQGRHALDAPVVEYCQTITEALWIRPIDGAGYQTPELDEAVAGDLDALADDLAGRLCVVMVAALGREQIERGKRITVAQLAALASQSPDHVRLRAREGQIRLAGDPLTCTAAEARRYLESVG